MKLLNPQRIVLVGVSIVLASLYTPLRSFAASTGPVTVPTIPAADPRCHKPPTVSVTPSTLIVAPGQKGSLGMMVTNNSAPGCPAMDTVLNLMSQADSSIKLITGWTIQFTPARLSIAPGATVTIPTVLGVNALVPQNTYTYLELAATEFGNGPVSARGKFTLIVRNAGVIPPPETTPVVTPPPPAPVTLSENDPLCMVLPTLSVTPSALVVAPGQKGNLSLEVKSNYATGCPEMNTTFLLMSVMDTSIKTSSPWSIQFSPDRILIAPGAKVTIPVILGVNSNVPENTYTYLALSAATATDFKNYAKVYFNLIVKSGPVGTPPPPRIDPPVTLLVNDPLCLVSPTVSVTPTSLIVAPGQKGSLSMVVKNNHAVGCPMDSSAFSLIAYADSAIKVPNPWTIQFTPGGLSMAPGETVTVAAVIGVDAGVPEKTYSMSFGTLGNAYGNFTLIVKNGGVVPPPATIPPVVTPPVVTPPVTTPPVVAPPVTPPVTPELNCHRAPSTQISPSVFTYDPTVIHNHMKIVTTNMDDIGCPPITFNQQWSYGGLQGIMGSSPELGSDSGYKVVKPGESISTSNDFWFYSTPKPGSYATTIGHKDWVNGTGSAGHPYNPLTFTIIVGAAPVVTPPVITPPVVTPPVVTPPVVTPPVVTPPVTTPPVISTKAANTPPVIVPSVVTSPVVNNDKKNKDAIEKADKMKKEEARKAEQLKKQAAHRAEQLKRQAAHRAEQLRKQAAQKAEQLKRKAEALKKQEAKKAEELKKQAAKKAEQDKAASTKKK